MNKYNAKRTDCLLNHKHDSAREAKRCNELQLLLRAGEIQEPIDYQPRFDFVINGKKLNHYYRADFRYWENGKRIVEDVKGYRTQVYGLKKELVEALYNVEIREV